MTPEEFIKFNVIDGYPSCYKCNMVTEKDALEAIGMARKEQQLQGWVCPKCGKSYSPNIPECASCNNKSKINANCIAASEAFGMPAKVQQPLGDLVNMQPIQQPLFRTILKAPDGEYQ